MAAIASSPAVRSARLGLRATPMDLLEQPEQPNEGLRDLFSRKAPWLAK
ncbi:MAG: hypothetical protein H6R26_2904 [Proteobacteria bacterium]|nr:hypothetical protein [Pseudomonadota bacterium]